jgi:tyrosinase
MSVEEKTELDSSSAAAPAPAALLPGEISQPTWNDNIVHFFCPGDIQCMSGHLKLNSYRSVTTHFDAIFGRVTNSNAADRMPLGQPMRQWTQAKVNTFQNWKNNGFPKGDKPPPRPSPPVVVIDSPNWEEHIQWLFTVYDIQEMRFQNVGVELGTYEGVTGRADDIYEQVSAKAMPAGTDNPKWTEEQIRTFYNWMSNGMPYHEGSRHRHGSPIPPASLYLPISSHPHRLRKDVNEVTEEEWKQLTIAFEALMKKPSCQVQSFYALADRHRAYCVHHANHFLPWHRLYVYEFENALRSVPGCENVTLPYWDFGNMDSIPDRLFKPPFASFTLPNGQPSQRFDQAAILENLSSQDFYAKILLAMSKTTWGQFDGYDGRLYWHSGLSLAHDIGHNSTGPTMQDQSITAFDPIFWFFHCNWDRLWWKWQTDVGATTAQHLLFLLQSAGDDVGWLTDPAQNWMSPWHLCASRTIDSHSLGVSYTNMDRHSVYGAVNPIPGIPPPGGKTSVAGNSTFTLSEVVIVVLECVHRIRIPGTFSVLLQARDGGMTDWETLGHDSFFQASQPENCENCLQNPFVNFTFPVLRNKLFGMDIRVQLKLATGELIPTSMCGNPTIRVEERLFN